MAAETRGFEDHTGFVRHEGAALKALQARFLPFWSKDVRDTGIYDAPTKLAVIRAQHHARYEMTGRLDEKTWIHIQTRRP